MDDTPLHSRDGIQLVAATDITCSPVDWIWPGWLAKGKLHLLVGEPAAGKTTLAMMIAASVSAGAKFPSKDQAPRGKVLIWSGEDDPSDTLLPRLLSAGVDLSQVFFIDGRSHNGRRRPFDPAKDMDALAQEIEAQGEVALLILDPIVNAVSGDSHRNTEVRRALQPIVDLAERTGVAVLGITHLAKGTAGQDPTQRVIGSIAFAAVARVVMVAGKGPNGSILVQAKNNLSAIGDGYSYTIDPAEARGVSTSVVHWGEPVSGSARELLGAMEADNEIGPSALNDAVIWLQEQLRDGPVSSSRLLALATENGISERTLQRAKKALKTRPLKTGTEWMCCLPPTVPTPPTTGAK